MNIYFISGNVGTDAPGWYIGPDGKRHPTPGWNPESMLELKGALSIIREAGRLKTPGLREGAMREVMAFAQKEFAQHIKDGGILVLG